MPENGAQRRRFPRYPCNLAVTVYMDATVVQTRIPQLSRGGCLIYPPLPPHQSPDIKLSFALGNSEAPINCKGEIVYTIAARGSGVAFTEISIYNQERITSFFEARPGAEETAGP